MRGQILCRAPPLTATAWSCAAETGPLKPVKNRNNHPQITGILQNSDIS
jgi:hypothetical protein